MRKIGVPFGSAFSVCDKVGAVVMLSLCPRCVDLFLHIMHIILSLYFFAMICYFSK